MPNLILRCWAVDPELCPHCHKEMKRSSMNCKGKCGLWPAQMNQFE